MDLFDLITDPRRTISVTVIVLSLLLGGIAVAIHANGTTFLGIGVLVVAIGCAVAALTRQKLPGVALALLAAAVFAGGVYVSLFLGRS